MPEPEPRDPYRPLLWPELIHRLRPFAAEVSQPVYIVGGAVRDALAGRPVHDVDLAVAQGGIRLARRIANGLDGGFFVLDRERDVARALLDTKDGKILIDVAGFRGASLLADLADRDFTINAMAVELGTDCTQIIDPLGGEADARAKVLRQCGPASLHNDPLRALRALRLAAQFELRIEPATRLSIHAVRERLYDSSVERVRDEFWRLLALPRVGAALRVASATGLLVRIVPETGDLSARPARNDAYSDAWQETLATLTSLRQIVAAFGPQRSDQHGATFGVGMLVMQLDRWRPQLQQHLQHSWPNGRPHSALLMLAAMLCAVGEASIAAELAVKRARAMCLANVECERLNAVLRWQREPLLLTELSDLNLYRFWRKTGVAGVDACLLAAARYLGEAGSRLNQDDWLAFVERIARLLQVRFEGMATTEPLLDGKSLMRALKLPPGPRVGVLLEHIREAQVSGQVNTVTEALAAARDWLESDGAQ